MNEDTINRDEELQLNNKIRSRRGGVFLILVGLVWMLEGLGYLNDTIADTLVLAFLLILIFPRFGGQGVKRSSLLLCESVRTLRG